MRLRTYLRRFRRAERGATIVEFALAIGPCLILTLGLCDLGFRFYLSSMLQGSLLDAARQQTVGGISAATINNFVQDRMKTIIPIGVGSNTLTVIPKSYYDYTGISTMEPLTTDANNNNVLDIGDCFTDYNSDGVRDTNSGAAGYGNSDDIVFYTATLTYASFVPMSMLLGSAQPTETITATTMMKNQPYASQPTPPTVCRSS